MGKFKNSLLETKNNLKMSWRFIKKRKSSLVLFIVFSILVSLIGVVVPILSAQLIVKLTDNLLKELFMVAVFIFIVEITRNIIMLFMRKVSDMFFLNTITDIKMEMFSEILKINIKEIDKNGTGVFIDRINNDVNDIVYIFSSLIDYFVDLISNIGILIAILYINPIMFLFFVITSLIICYINKVRRDMYCEQDKTFRKIREKRTSLTTEIIRGIRDIKLLNAGDSILKRTKRQLDEVNQEKILMDKTSRNFSLLSSSIRDFFDVAFIGLGIILISNGSLTVSSALILNNYRGRVEYVITFYDRLSSLIKDYNISATRVFEVLSDHFEKEVSGNIKINNSIDKIEFRNVNFSYTDTPVLNNINFVINRGERIGIVGRSGSGKSTIFNLISKLYNVVDGEVLINDININEIADSSLREHLSLISQNPYLFNFSVLENIKISNLKATEDEVTQECKKAQIYDTIMNFENGFDTLIGEGGVILSGGERQRLAIARALLKKADVLLFDEATSSLDNITQNDVQEAIYGLDRNKTILIIAHRLSTIKECDRIYVIENGKIVGVGTHKELLKSNKYYKELYKNEID